MAARGTPRKRESERQRNSGNHCGVKLHKKNQNLVQNLEPCAALRQHCGSRNAMILERAVLAVCLGHVIGAGAARKRQQEVEAAITNTMF